MPPYHGDGLFRVPGRINAGSELLDRLQHERVVFLLPLSVFKKAQLEDLSSIARRKNVVPNSSDLDLPSHSDPSFDACVSISNDESRGGGSCFCAV